MEGKDIVLQDMAIDELLMRRRSLRRQMLTQKDLYAVRIAVMSGSTPNEFISLLELFLLEAGFAAEFHTPDYGRFYEDTVLDSHELEQFKPDIVFIHTSVRDLRISVPAHASQSELEALVLSETSRFRNIWNSIHKKLGCVVVQNNFEFPLCANLGNLDGVVAGGATRLVREMNREFARAAEQDSLLVMQDVCALSAGVGLDEWFDLNRWFSYKLLYSPEANRAMAVSFTSLVRAIYGRTKKVLVLDMDNTLWGGVIGDDGVDHIQIGLETPVAEAYTAFQEYCLKLRERGILLAVCSKNNEDTALQGFEHPDSVLKREHFASFKANWNPKHENILLIAQELNLGADSFVFVDDNPAERAIVEAQIDGIAVPDIGEEVTEYIERIERGRYFETVSLSREDTQRSVQYSENARRAEFEVRFANYEEYLDSLEMKAEIDSFKSVYLERIAQLTNKTNQFNLTTRRYTQAEIEAVAKNPACIGLYGKLSDSFGDHGLISVVLAIRANQALQIDLWLMSCRVLKRGMEVAMLDALVLRAQAAGVRRLIGLFIPTKKNAMVAEFYPSLGFSARALSRTDMPEGSTEWELNLSNYRPQNKHIQVLESQHAE